MISAIPATGSNSFFRWAGLSVSTSSQVGRTRACNRCPPCAVPSRLPTAAWACTWGSPSFKATSPIRDSSSTCSSRITDEIAHLRGLDLKGLRSRWQSVFRRPAPAHLTRHLLFAVIAYRIQADRFGDIDHATRQVLDRTVAKEAEPAMSARLASFDQSEPSLLQVLFWSESGIDSRSG